MAFFEHYHLNGRFFYDDTFRLIGRISKDRKFITNENGLTVGYIKDNKVTDYAGNYIGYINKDGNFFDRGGNLRGYYNEGESNIGVVYIIMLEIVGILIILLFKELNNFLQAYFW
jgi:hypothetical protein